MTLAAQVRSVRNTQALLNRSSFDERGNFYEMTFKLMHSTPEMRHNVVVILSSLAPHNPEILTYMEVCKERNEICLCCYEAVWRQIRIYNYNDEDVEMSTEVESR